MYMWREKCLMGKPRETLLGFILGIFVQKSDMLKKQTKQTKMSLDTDGP